VSTQGSAGSVDAGLVTGIAAVRARIVAAAAAAGRDPAAVRLIGVTKTQPAEVAAAAVAAGLTDLGENRTSELVAKAAAVPDVRWHLVGRLQRNKVREVVGRGWLLHAVDREPLVAALAARAAALGAVQDVLVQVNVGDDPAKGGCDLTRAADLVTYAAGHATLRVRGLMTVPPLPPSGTDPGRHAAPLFRRLREVRDEVRERHPEVEELSMGMSDDLEAAVQEGATMVRIGTALFGPRADGAA
jgi:pyridoxal phosphate enzyme (YggS family)